MVDDEDAVQLSEYCFNVCEALKATVHGRNAESLDESVRTALDDLERCVAWSCSARYLPRNSRVTREIERTLRRAKVPGTKRNKGGVEGHKLKIQEIHNALNALSTSLDENLNSNERVPDLPPVDSHKVATTSVSGSGTSSALHLPILCRVLINPASSPSIFQPADVWSDVHSLRMNSLS